MERSSVGSPHRRHFRRMISRFAFVAMASITFPTCHNTPSEPEPETAGELLPYLLGEWAWECSTGGFVGETVCAATSGLTQTWEFSSDSVFRWLRSDTVVATASFRVVRQGPGITGDSINLLVLDGSPTVLALEMPTRDQLVAIEQCYDCYTSFWGRMK